ncbi:MAG: hypothetical protein R3B38_00495 [Patescibacteria group bacterium]
MFKFQKQLSFLIITSLIIGTVFTNSIQPIQAAQVPADLANTSWWIANDNIRDIAISSDESTAYIVGEFTKLGYNTGFGATVSASTSEVLSSTAKFNTTSVFIAINDGSGGWYVGGTFDEVDGDTDYAALAHINSDGSLDTTWNAGITSLAPQVYALYLTGTTLYVGGVFTTIGGASRTNLAAVSTATGLATSFDPNMNGTVRALAADGSILYAGGQFTDVNSGTTRNRIAAFDLSSGTPSTATSFDPDVANNAVYTLAVHSNNLYAGGSFTTVNGATTRNRLAGFDSGGTVLADFNPNATSGQVNSIDLDGDILYVGGTFISIGGSSRSRIAAFDLGDADPDAATTFNPNMSSTVERVMVNSSTIYIGGAFTTGSGVSRSKIMAVDANGDETSFAPETDNTVYAIAANGTNVFIGGTFLMTNAITRNRIAAIDLSTGEPTNFAPSGLTTGIVYSVALSSDDSTLYIGGSFSSVNGSSRGDGAALATSDGTLQSWNPATNGIVYDIKLNSDDSIVYIGGTFTTVNSGGSTRNRAASYTTSDDTITSWDPNLDGNVRDILISGSTVYLGGEFANSGATARTNVAAYDLSGGTPSTPTSLSATIAGGDVYSLGLRSGILYLGGDFTTIGGTSRTSAGSIAIADSSLDSWNPQLTNTIYDIYIDDNVLYVSGNNGVGPDLFSGFDLTGADPNTADVDFDPDPSGDGGVGYALRTFNEGEAVIGGSFTILAGGGAYSSNRHGYFAKFASGNSSPNAPTNLGPPEVVNYGQTEEVNPLMQFTLSDDDTGDTLKYQIQIDDTVLFQSPVIDYTSALGSQGQRSFRVGQAAGSGTYTVGAEGDEFELDDGFQWRVRGIDDSGLAGEWTNANTKYGLAFVVIGGNSGSGGTSGGGGGSGGGGESSGGGESTGETGTGETGTGDTGAGNDEDAKGGFDENSWAVVINNGAKLTNSADVSLKFVYNPDEAFSMLVYNDNIAPRFPILEPVQQTKSWKLCGPDAPGAIPCKDGARYDVKVLFYDIKNVAIRRVLMDSIVYNSKVSDNAKLDDDTLDKILKGLQSVLGDSVESTFESFSTPFYYEWQKQNGTVEGDAHVIRANAGDSITLNLELINRATDPKSLVLYGAKDLIEELAPFRGGHQLRVGSGNPRDVIYDWLGSASFVHNPDGESNRFDIYNGDPVAPGEVFNLDWSLQLKSDIQPGTYLYYVELVKEFDAWAQQVDKQGKVLPTSDIFWKIIVE